MPTQTIDVVFYAERNERILIAKAMNREKLCLWSDLAKHQMYSGGRRLTEIALPRGIHLDASGTILRFIENQDLDNPVEFTYNNMKTANPGIKIPNDFEAMVTFHVTADLLGLSRHLKGTTLHAHLLHHLRTTKLELPDFYFAMDQLEGIDRKLYWTAWEQTTYYYARDSGLRKDWGKSIELAYLVDWCDKRGWGTAVRRRIAFLDEKHKAKKMAQARIKEEKEKQREGREKERLAVNDRNFPTLS